ncbi:MAG TPA: hypothetical protein VGB52_04550 [Actinomycetota bacterium]
MRRREVCLLLLAFTVAGCSSNGSHPPAEAAPIARELWRAAQNADLEEVQRLIRACADPLVAYPDDDGRTFTARELARARLDGLVGPPLDTQDQVALALAEDLLREAEEDWDERCARAPVQARAPGHDARAPVQARAPRRS